MESWIPFIPEAASTFARRVDALYFYLTGVTLFFTVLISVVLTFFVIKYRRRTPYETPRPVAGSLKLETIWSVIPFLIAMSMFAWGTSVYFTQYRMPTNAMEIYVVGKQWMWKFQHTTGQREINELHVPVGRKIKLIMTTEDVIHSFFVPAFRTKSDVVPGRYTSVWFEATKPGRYHLFCAEYCGMNHSGMGGWVEVMDEKDFDDWLSGNANQQSPVAAGQQLFQATLGCASCHGEKGEGGRGPTLLGLFGTSVLLEGGTKVTADETYIRESILNPQAKVVAGYKPIMPTFAGQVTEEQLLQLVAYIKSLNPSQTQGIQMTPPPRNNNSATGVGTPAGQGANSTESQRMNPLNSTAPRGNQAGGPPR
ncbi:MAG TPA: cytochrome c oxidase subunit II [Pyrinomonadaceae bacterium]|nr:cytochrome c oxidase subunit II [Pyrinomonadaceae bacterium]